MSQLYKILWSILTHLIISKTFIYTEKKYRESEKVTLRPQDFPAISSTFPTNRERSSTRSGYGVRHHEKTKWAFYPCGEYNELYSEGAPTTFAFETPS
jgi:hypothetical protein